jgi:oxygen-independent coproporphyrinogen III oxidase
MLSPQQISQLLGSFNDCFGISTGAEVSMEAHPSTVDAAQLEGYRQAGINRISFGVESLVPQELRALGRLGDERAPITALHNARRAGFHSIAVDLMYGIPRQTTASWSDTLQRLVTLGPHHLSLYPLQIEPKTVFGRRRQRQELAVPEDGQVVEMYRVACDVLASAGYVHYEVGSWCRAGHESRHNLAYWHNREFIGLGVGAHGYVDARRTVNVQQTTRYIELAGAGIEPTLEAEEIDRETRRVETIMLGLRLLAEGLDIDHVRAEYGWDLREHRGSELSMLAHAGLIRTDGTRVFLTETAVPVANEVWERLAL